MKTDRTLDALAESYGIVGEFKDLSGQVRPTAPETKKALLRANGLDVGSSAQIGDALDGFKARRRARHIPEEIVAFGSKPVRVRLPEGVDYHLILEGDDNVAAEGKAGSDMLHLPDLPIGLHHLTMLNGGEEQKCRVIIAPESAPSTAVITGKERIWGINGALYGLHSTDRPGPGSFTDLALAAECAAAAGAGFLGINPIHAMGWHSSDIISPYSPSHRGFLNTTHIDVEAVAPNGDRDSQPWQTWQQSAAPSNRTNPVDYSGHRQQLQTLLQHLYDAFCTGACEAERSAYARFCHDGGIALARYAHFEVLSADAGSDWRTWPDPYQSQTPPDLDSLPHPSPHHFHAWLQWIAQDQVEAAQRRGRQAGLSLGLYLDLAVGSRRDGAEAWCEAEVVAQGVSVGAPPDHLSPAGQNWSIIGYAPQNLAATDYAAWRGVLRQTMASAGMIRIDHALGLKRSYWIPDDGAPGGYIQQPFEALMALICIEASRANTVVVGEDLGLVPKGFRTAMHKRGLYSYSVLQYEQNDVGTICSPDALSTQSLVCFGTHDTPTLAGYREGRDIDWWEKLSWITNKAANTDRARRRLQLKGLATADQSTSPPASQDKVGNSLPTLAALRTSVHQSLAASNIAMVSIQLDDLFGVVEAQNLPGTIDEHPNWRRRYELPVTQISSLGSFRETIHIMQDTGRSTAVTNEEESRN